jgi:ribosome recycling factor
MDLVLRTQLNELEKKMTAYMMLLHFRYMNLCVKAEAASLLPVNVIVLGDQKNIEEVADVAIPDEYHLAVIPKDDEFREEVIHGVTFSHPEFKLNMKTVRVSGKDKPYMEYEMPEVDKNRRDFLNKAVKSLFDEAKLKIDTAYHEEQAGFAAYLENNSTQLREVNAALDDIYDKSLQSIRDSRDDKLHEIEEGYLRYLDRQSGQQVAEGNSGYDVTQSMKF